MGLRSSDGSTADSFSIFSKTLPGIKAGQKLVGPAAISESFQLVADKRQIKPTCNGKLLSSVYDLNLGLSHDVACQCCSGSPEVSLRVMIFPSPLEFQLPSTFTTTSWQPKMMPTANLAINNAFDNYKIGQMMNAAIGSMGSNYPPPPPMGGGYNNNQNNNFGNPNQGHGNPNQGYNYNNQNNQGIMNNTNQGFIPNNHQGGYNNNQEYL